MVASTVSEDLKSSLEIRCIARSTRVPILLPKSPIYINSSSCVIASQSILSILEIVILRLIDKFRVSNSYNIGSLPESLSVTRLSLK